MSHNDEFHNANDLAVSNLGQAIMAVLKGLRGGKQFVSA